MMQLFCQFDRGGAGIRFMSQNQSHSKKHGLDCVSVVAKLLLGQAKKLGAPQPGLWTFQRPQTNPTHRTPAQLPYPSVFLTFQPPFPQARGAE